MEQGDLTAAAAAWEELFQLSTGHDVFHQLAYARVLAGLGRIPEATTQLQRALTQSPAYGFYPRATKLVKKLGAASESYVRECRLALLGTSTTSLLSPIVQALCLRDRIRAEVYEGLYGSVTQEILDPSSGLARFRPNVVFLLANWRDLRLPAITENEAEFAEGVIERQKALWERLAERFGCHVVQSAYDFPAQEPHGYLATALPGGRARVIELVNRRLIEAAPSHVSILDLPSLQRGTGLARWEDPNQWYSFQQHPGTEALPGLAELMLAHVRSVLGLTRKLLVTDLDNTLWTGVIGEDGLDGIKIEAHARLQQYMLDLKARGILLAVASKNNHEDACLPFLKHPQMLLRLEDFAAFEANWNDKASSLREIARTLSLGLDSFVFLDDNPIEREWVRSQIPDVAVCELGGSVFSYVSDLDRPRYFYTLSLSAEDSARANQYRSEAARKHLQATAQSLDEFLAQLQLQASCVPVDERNVPRVAQLTNKTNQFNLTTRRYTEVQVRQLADDPAAWTGAFHLSDRMGDYGLIGVIFCRGRSAHEWEIDTWLMSCRVLGRQMEKFMFDRLIEAAQARGIRTIFAEYLPTPKNGLVRDHYDQLGFTRVSERHYEFRVPHEEVVTATHIRSRYEDVTVAMI